MQKRHNGVPINNRSRLSALGNQVCRETSSSGLLCGRCSFHRSDFATISGECVCALFVSPPNTVVSIKRFTRFFVLVHWHSFPNRHSTVNTVVAPSTTTAGDCNLGKFQGHERTPGEHVLGLPSLAVESIRIYWLPYLVTSPKFLRCLFFGLQQQGYGALLGRQIYDWPS